VEIFWKVKTYGHCLHLPLSAYRYAQNHITAKSAQQRRLRNYVHMYGLISIILCNHYLQ